MGADDQPSPVRFAEARVYMNHVLALFWPGRTVQTHEVASNDATTIGDLNEWKTEDLDLLIAEGRRTFDGQAARFDRIRATAQVLLPTATALLVVLGSELGTISTEPTTWVRWAEYSVWILGTLLVLLGLLGSAAVLTVKSEFGALLPTLISQQTPPIRKDLALAYARQAMRGEVTVATRLTVVRDAVALVAIGGTLHLALWVVRVV